MLQELCHVHAMPEVQVDDMVLEDIRSDLLSSICHDTLLQEGGRWQRERKLRITASRCRAYFTFLPTEHRSWAGKVQLMYCESFRGNKATRHGKRPDGVAEANGVPSILVEVKSPEAGINTSANDLITAKKVEYIIKEVNIPATKRWKGRRVLKRGCEIRRRRAVSVERSWMYAAALWSYGLEDPTRFRPPSAFGIWIDSTPMNALTAALVFRRLTSNTTIFQAQEGSRHNEVVVMAVQTDVVSSHTIF
ncbi:hypothetical protein HPB47_013529 [Ixodes persulcatus]|uniref:Uncharacterized protein n=1 Tax=Ixodes persulcatus TaxID=34615 RepID=A0AC60QY95_IXOPE|nr:hypothetical protein HPB47_013529 [Ixodes persulcatus]